MKYNRVEVRMIQKAYDIKKPNITHFQQNYVK